MNAPNVVLWVLQIALAGIFLSSGISKLFLSKERLVAIGQTGPSLFPLPVVRFAAGCELLGVAGIVLPWWLDIAPVLTPLAACGFVIVMVGAVPAHVKLREPRNVVGTSLILLAAACVAVARFAQL